MSMEQIILKISHWLSDKIQVKQSDLIQVVSADSPAGMGMRQGLLGEPARDIR